jgi:hypothetical protein
VCCQAGRSERFRLEKHATNPVDRLQPIEDKGHNRYERSTVEGDNPDNKDIVKYIDLEYYVRE